MGVLEKSWKSPGFFVSKRVGNLFNRSHTGKWEHFGTAISFRCLALSHDVGPTSSKSNMPEV